MPAQSSNYQPQASDTSVAADQLRFRLLRQQSMASRLEMAAALERSARELSWVSLQQRFPSLLPEAFAEKVLRTWSWCGGRFCSDVLEGILANISPSPALPGKDMNWIQDSLALAVQLHSIFQSLGVDYYITGGVAATAYGEPKTTQDLDVVLNLNPDLNPADLTQLISALEAAGFYVPGVEEVLTRQTRTLQIIHQETILQADLVLSGADAFDMEKFRRRRRLSIPNRGDFYFASPEDLILSKLQWRQSSQSEK
ncbi:hypothetical protein P7L53_02245 [Thermoleptolyngbya sichuanensis XZ-Cy5]|uniref:hypothetical protein n=1 Tax=Thermoleptolyngbya sichuanensis TaxID=2885951 RepID=UPI00240CEB54|nr:hypothetical protein [Thermoleptolyngbya sichuanensis]MDG2615055.1 hypothetical protein [Thermoleptolyngbya sichuanensis XZ-Cy5]